MSDDTWRAEAACKGLDPNFFFEDKNLPEIRKRCLGCPVYDECRAWCVDSYDEIPRGIVAGYTSIDRMRLHWGEKVPDWRMARPPKVVDWRTPRRPTGPVREKTPRQSRLSEIPSSWRRPERET